MKKNQGFTLIEMLVVVAIVALLSSVVVVGLGGARSKARDAKRLSEIQQILNWAELRYTVNGYPTSTTGMPSTNDPLGVAYQAAASGTQTFYAGGCLENPEDQKVDSGCGSYTCTTGYKYCRVITGQ